MRNVFLGISFFLSLSCFDLNAAFLKTDVSNVGDAGAVLDSESGLEWLNISYTKGQSLSFVEQRITSGDLQGWRLPTENEVVDMLNRFFMGSI